MVKVSVGTASHIFVMVICRGYWLQEFATAVSRGFLPCEFAAAICRGNLPWVCFVYVGKPFFCVSKSFFFESKSFFNWKQTFFYMWAKLFLFMRISLLTVFLFVIAVAVIGHRMYPLKTSENHRISETISKDSSEKTDPK